LREEENDMGDVQLTLIDEGRTTRVTASAARDAITLSPAVMADTLGWTLEAQGLCRGDVCIPVRGHESRINADGVDLGTFAQLLDRPLALDAEHAVAAIGTSAGTRLQQLDSGLAPDFTLPDLSGKTHSLSDFRGKKVLLIAYASW
jgi:hypothetical protein